MPTVLQSELTVNDNVVQTLDRIRQQALAQYPKEAARITRGHAIAAQGGVHLDGHGLAAVQSQRHPETWYTVNGHCTCHDASRAPAGRCKHRWAKALLVQALTYLAQHSGLPVEELPTPYAFPRWRKYEATYQGLESGESRSMASPSFSNQGSSSSGRQTSGRAGTVSIMKWR